VGWKWLDRRLHRVAFRLTAAQFDALADGPARGGHREHPAGRPQGRPEPFGLVERVAKEVGAPVPQLLLISYEMNAFTTTVGLRGQRVLCPGLPILATLEPRSGSPSSATNWATSSTATSAAPR
jgi:hypothetical protein